VVDGSGSDDRLPGEDLKSLVMELKSYDRTLIRRPAVVFLNKTDLKGPSSSSPPPVVMCVPQRRRKCMNILGGQQIGSASRCSRAGAYHSRLPLCAHEEVAVRGSAEEWGSSQTA
jgi:GTPase involved in cell partitioning and DNA repair